MHGSSYIYGLCEEPKELPGSVANESIYGFRKKRRNNANAKIKEYTYRDLVAELGGSTIQYITLKNHTKENKLHWKDIIIRYNNILRQDKMEQARLRTTRKKPPIMKTLTKKTKTKTKNTTLKQTKEPEDKPQINKTRKK